MVLAFLTVSVMSVLVGLPLIQRVRGQARDWHGQLYQLAVWAFTALGLLWSIMALDGGRGLQALGALGGGIVCLVYAQSRGWQALSSGRLAQLALLTCALYAAQQGGTRELALAGSTALLGALYDRLLGVCGSAPPPHDPLQPPAVSAPLSLGLTGTVTQQQAPVAATPPAPPAPAPVSPSPLSDRPPLPPPGKVAEWVATQATQAAEQAEQNRQAQQAQERFSRTRRLPS